MRVLIINFEMNENSGVLAWQAQVAREIARACEFVVVLTQHPIGQFTAPANMYVEAVPKRPFGVPWLLGGLWLMNGRVWRLCRRYRIDVCFIHMASEWSYRLWFTFRLLQIPTLVWYAHGTVSNRLRLAHRCATRLVTSTPEGLRLTSNKVRVIGQGVDTDLFDIPACREDDRNDIIYVGRVSRRKRVGLLIEVMAALKQLAPDCPLRLKIIGPLLTTDDVLYDAEIRAKMWQLGLQTCIDFVGFVPQQHIPLFYSSAFLHLNVSQTGSMDKTVVEALACGCPVLTGNEAFYELLADYPDFVIQDEQPAAIAWQILKLYENRNRYSPQALRRLVLGKHDQQSYVKKVLANLHELL